ncbi:MAG: rhomboid family intramembrane serine protease [Desulfamplus sp.]|nr:rhomboid family intramembrane serine protease [Desulfamplus sp.]
MCRSIAQDDRFTVNNKEEADTLLLVLESQGIQARLEYRRNGFSNSDGYELILNNSELEIELAEEAISLFYYENGYCSKNRYCSKKNCSSYGLDYTANCACCMTNCDREHCDHNSTNEFKLFDSRAPAFKELFERRFVLTLSAIISVSASAILLCAVHAATIFHNNHREMVLKYGASALYILQGEYYRTVTALMFHSDIEHLAGNVAGILLLAIPLCSAIGTGKGIFLIILSGAAGNLLNAYMFRSAHISIGASTAVMGAVGVLVSLQMKRRYNTIRQYKDLSPIKIFGNTVSGFKKGFLAELRDSAIFVMASGAAFVGIMSGGEYTDVSAHVFGFISGVIIGIIGFIIIPP